MSFDGVGQQPHPVQRPHPPIVVGGHSAATYRRVVQAGNGWYGWELDVAQTAQALAHLQAAREQYDRPAGLGEIEVSITPPGIPDLDTVRRYADAGVHRLVLQPPTMDGTAMDDLIDHAGRTLIDRT